MPCAAKVNVFQAKIGGDQKIVLGRGAQHGAVVADAAYQRAGGRSGLAANSLNEFSFR
jgi:hypothetical protein